MAEHTLSRWRRQRMQKQPRQTAHDRVERPTLALLEYDRGDKISAIPQRQAVDRRSIQRWIAAFAHDSDPQELRDDARPERPARWTDQITRRREQLRASSPGPWGYMAVDWTMPLPAQAVDMTSPLRRFAKILPVIHLDTGAFQR